MKILGKKPEDEGGTTAVATAETAVPTETPPPEKHFFTVSELMDEYKEMKEPLIDGLLH